MINYNIKYSNFHILIIIVSYKLQRKCSGKLSLLFVLCFQYLSFQELFVKGTGVPDILHLMVSHLVIFIVVMHPLRGCVVSSYPITWVLDYSRKAVEQFSIPVHEENLSNQLNHP